MNNCLITLFNLFENNYSPWRKVGNKTFEEARAFTLTDLARSFRRK